MHGYEEDLEEDTGYDSYYSDDDVGMEQDEYEEEEEVKPTKEELKFLEFRQQLKESARKKMQKGGSNVQSSQEKRKKLPYNDFGSFFGPSKPVISSRVIQESKSLLENEHLAAKILNSNQAKKRPVSTSVSGTKNELQERRPKVVNEVRRKVQALKDTRDYSFLLSDDADLPVSSKESLSRNGSIHKSEPRSAQLSARPKQSSGINGRTANGPREEKRPVSVNGLMNSRLAPSGGQMQQSRPASSGGQMHQSSRSQINQSRTTSSGNQMQQSRPASAGRPASSGSQMHNSRPVSSGRPASSGSQMQSRPATGRPASSSSQVQQRATPSGSQRPGSSTNRQAPLRAGLSMNSQTSQSANRNGQPNSRLDTQRSAPPAKRPVTMDHRKQLASSSNGGVGPGRPASTSRPLPSKAPISSLERKSSISGSKTSLQNGQRPSSSRPLLADPRQRMEQRKLSQDRTMSRMIPKQSAPTSKHQMSQSAPKRPPPRESLDDRRPKKKRPNLSEDDMAFSMIRQMFKTDRFAGRDDESDSDMEANFEDIMREEKRSARIAREEDEEQLRLIEEEEKRERLRLEKKRKLSR